MSRELHVPKLASWLPPAMLGGCSRAGLSRLNDGRGTLFEHALNPARAGQHGDQELLLRDEALVRMLRGVNLQAEALKATLGPRIRTVVLDREPRCAIRSGGRFGQCSSHGGPVRCGDS